MMKSANSKGVNLMKRVNHKINHGNLSKFVLRIFTCVFTAILALNLLVLPAGAIDYTKRNLEDADFSGQDLTDSVFDKANLRSSNLSNANLQGVRFFGANMDRANLEGADLTYAVLDSARMTRVNLTNAVLEGAFATNTKFEGAIIDGADFTDVFLRPDVEELLCSLAKGTNPVTGRDTKDTLFCP